MQSKVNFILGAVAFLLLGFLAGLLIGRTVMDRGGGITFSDGKTLEVRLNEIEKKIDDTKKAVVHTDEVLTRITTPPDKGKRKGPDPNKKHEFDLSDAPWKGAENPKVVLIEFADFQCPYCKRFDGAVEKILEKYPNDVRFYFKVRLIHQSALPEHEASLAAKAEGKFWEMYKLIFANFGRHKPEQLEEYAAQTGLDLDKFRKAMDQHIYQDKVKKDDAEAKQYSINSTPAVFLNGYLQIDRNPDVLMQKIEEILKGGE